VSDAADAPRRLADYPTLTTTLYPKDNLISIFDLVQRSVKQYSDRPCLGEGVCVCACGARNTACCIGSPSFQNKYFPLQRAH